MSVLLPLPVRTRPDADLTLRSLKEMSLLMLRKGKRRCPP
jgi:hypothetical protein